MKRDTLSALVVGLSLAAASMPAVPQEMPTSRRSGKQPRKFEGECLGQQSQEIKDWNAAVEAKKAAKRERKQLKDQP